MPGPKFKPNDESSPERPLIKNATHKRMQSLQPGHVRDLSKFIEGGLSPTKSEKATPLTTPKKKEEEDVYYSKSPDKDSADNSPDNATPLAHVRPSLRRPQQQSILGENTPPQSATMLALQSMGSRNSMREGETRDSDNALVNVTNGSTSVGRSPQTFDAISGQILSLTSIATSLQREMAQLNRRSKDNATDLVSLKEATNARDEDIRKSLRDLATNLTRPGANSPYTVRGADRDGLLLDDKPHTPLPRSIKGLSLPRIPSPTSFAATLDRGLSATPNSSYNFPPPNVDNTATIALVEKVIREMGTKEGQDLLVDRLSELANRLVREGAETQRKMEELLDFVKQEGASRALVVNGNRSKSRTYSFENAPNLQQDSAIGMSDNESMVGGKNKMADMMSDDMLNLLKTIKASAAQGGGMTAEVKALVRELRGEVLGMGRDIGRKLEQAAASNASNSAKDAAAESEQISRIIDDGLHNLKEHLDMVMQENARQTAQSAASRQIDGEDVYNAVKTAIAESHATELQKDDVVDAVRHAWENYKPEIQVQHYGLEKDELLACLQQGMHEVWPEDRSPATREEVFIAVVEGLKAFEEKKKMETGPQLTRDDILDGVRDCLEEFEFPAAPQPEKREDDLTREDVLDAAKEALHTFQFPIPELPEPQYSATREDMLEAVREGLNTFEFPAPAAGQSESQLTREDVLEAVNTSLATFEFPIAQPEENQLVAAGAVSLSKDEVYEAVLAGLATVPPPSEELIGEVKDRLHQILEVMHAEFKAVSDEAKDNVAAHGRDTEQVLDATKDGFEKLRLDIEAYVDKAAGDENTDDILKALDVNFTALRGDINKLVEGTDGPIEEVKLELENLRDSISNQVVPAVAAVPNIDKDEILTALHEGLDDILEEIKSKPQQTSEGGIAGATDEILDALADGLDSLRNDVERMTSKPVDLTVSYEILDTLRTGMEGLRLDIERLKESGFNDTASQHDRGMGAGEMAAITSGAVIAGAAADSLKRDDIENLEILISGLAAKVESLENMAPPAPIAVPGTVTRDDLTEIEETLRNVQQSVVEMAQVAQTQVAQSQVSADTDATVQKEDLEAIETLIRNTKAKVDELVPENSAKTEHIAAVEAIIKEVKEDVNELLSYVPESAKKEDVTAIDSLIKDVMVMLTDIKEVSENDGNVGIIVLSVKEQLDKMLTEDLAALASKEDVTGLKEDVNSIKDQITALKESEAVALTDRQAEIVGVSESVGEVKTLLEEFRDAIKEKIEASSTGVAAISNVLDTLEPAITASGATITTGVRELLETMKKEFEDSAAGVAGAKLETDEKFTQTWGKIDEKFADLLIKYDDAQQAAEAKAKLIEEGTAESTAALTSTKELAEELKLLIDTLGSTLTDSVEKMDEASKTVFGRVEDTHTKLEEAHADIKTESQLTRDEIAKTSTAVEGVHTDVKEYQPKILETVKDVLMVVGEHFEHSKTSVDALQESLKEREEANQTHIQGLLTNIPQPEKYDDGQVHEKLDKLVDHMQEAGKAFTQLEALDEIHKKVMETASEVSQFVAAQTLRIANDHEDKIKEAEEAAVVLERRLAEKERVESDIASGKEEADRIRHEVDVLRAEQITLGQQKLRLTADVSSLETALRIRKEELQYMEARAEGLERRILEGVIDHSRAFMLGKTKSKDQMNLKRVPSQAPSATASSVSGTGSTRSRPNYTTTSSAMGMAMKAPRALVPLSGNGNGDSRRNFSLNQIGAQAPKGSSALKNVFKRSHSVKEPSGLQLRKGSWNGGAMMAKYGELNKENLAVKEADEDEVESLGDTASDTGTLRRASQSGSLQGGGVDGSEYTDDYSEYTETESGYTETESGYTETDAGWTESAGPTPFSERGDPHGETESELEGEGELVMYEQAA